LNLTAVGATQSGHLAAYPFGTSTGTSALNFSSGKARSNNGTLGVGTNGGLTVKVSMPSGSVHLVVDVFGYFL
jgi:hypothetical protein